MKTLGAIALGSVLALPVMAQAPDVSPIPMPRGDQISSASSAQDDLDDDAARPVLRPAAEQSLDDPTRGADDGAAPFGSATETAIAQSLRPVARPEAFAASDVETDPVAPEAATPLSVVGTHQITVRSGLFGSNTQVMLVPAFADDGAGVLLASPRPLIRPEGLEARVRAAATRTTPARVTEPGRRGQLCGQAGLFGEELPPITGRIAGCGITAPVRLREVDGIALTSPATINCTTATALQEWVAEARDIVGRTGGGIANLRVVASYSCRTRNNQPGARLSEHATGNGIDIAGIGLVNGQELTVSFGWQEPTQGPILRALHEAACGPFGTVLGPDGDRFHQDHFHFDVAGYRAGPFCR
ncbi:MAG: extensin family protein [Pseudomonadota bacterium]